MLCSRVLDDHSVVTILLNGPIIYNIHSTFNAMILYSLIRSFHRFASCREIWIYFHQRQIMFNILILMWENPRIWEDHLIFRWWLVADSSQRLLYSCQSLWINCLISVNRKQWNKGPKFSFENQVLLMSCLQSSKVSSTAN